MTLILIALGLTLAWYPAKLGWAYYHHRRDVKQYLHDVKVIEELKDRMEAEEEERQRRKDRGLSPEYIGITGCGGTWDGIAHLEYELTAKAILKEINRRAGATASYQGQERWPTKDPIRGHWRLETEEEAKARRQK